MGDGKMIDRSPEWSAAWKSEIHSGSLSKYATTNPTEGFAEFARVAWLSPQVAKAYYPACWNIWKQHGLVEDSEA
jgi:hypothetical protein